MVLQGVTLTRIVIIVAVLSQVNGDVQSAAQEFGKCIDDCNEVFTCTEACFKKFEAPQEPWQDEFDKKAKAFMANMASQTTTPEDIFTETPDQKKALEMHNQFRSTHKSPKLTLNQQLCQEAQAYAKWLANKGQLIHSPIHERFGHGENIGMSCSNGTVEETVTSWYNEVCDPGYNFTQSAYQAGTDHFTQVVWKASKELGIGIATTIKDDVTCTYVVGRYSPTGNTASSFQENVLKPDQPLTEYCKAVNP